MKLVVLGLSLSSSWGNGHATTFRSLLRQFHSRGHKIQFLEREQPWYRDNRDLESTDYCSLKFYNSLEELKSLFREDIASADAVLIGSYVPDGRLVMDWVLSKAKGRVAFYDIDTPITNKSLLENSCPYLSAEQIRRFHVYFSFTGGPFLDQFARVFSAQKVQPLYCSADIVPKIDTGPNEPFYTLGYLGTFSADRQPALEELLCRPAREEISSRFVVAGAQYPEQLVWPANVERRVHLPPDEHASFYNSQKFALNITRQEMVSAGFSPSVRLFEAAAHGVPVISDEWLGLDTFFKPGLEIFTAKTSSQVVKLLRNVDEAERRKVAHRFHERFLKEHTSAHRAETLEKALTS